MSSNPSVTEVILHCQKQIKKNPSEEKLLHYIGRLSRLRISTNDLITTGIGRTVNQLSRMDGVVGEKAYQLVANWKALVEAERSSESSAESGSPSSSEDEKTEMEHRDLPEKRDENDDDVDETVTEYSQQKLPSSPPAIRINGHVPKQSDDDEDDEDEEVALPNFASYSRNQDESDNESDSDRSDRLCIDDAPPMHSDESARAAVESSEDEEENQLPEKQAAAVQKFFPSSSSEAESGDSEVEIKSKHHSHKSQGRESKIPTSKHADEKKRDAHRKHRHHHKHSSESPSKAHHRHHSSHEKKAKVKEEPKSRSTSRSPSRSPTPHRHHRETPVKVKTERKSRSRSPEGNRMLPISPSKLTSATSAKKKNGFLDVPSFSIKKEKETSSSPSKGSSSTNHNSSSNRSRSPEENRMLPISPSKLTSATSAIKKNGFLDVPSFSIKKEKETSSSPSKGSSSTNHNSSSKNKGTKEKKSDRERDRERLNEKDRKKRAADSSSERDSKRMKVDEQSKTPEKRSNAAILDSLKPKLLPRLNVEIDSTSGLNFSDVLSGLDTKKLKKPSSKKSSPVKKGSSPAPSSVRIGTPPLNPSSDKKRISLVAPMPVKKAVAKISPFVYEPPPQLPLYSTPSASSSRVEESSSSRYWEDSGLALSNINGAQHDGDALSTMMSSRNQRTKVYSGVKTGFVGKIPKLYDMCIRVLQENIEDLGYSGGIPFEILEPVISRATLSQLKHIEHYNPYLIEFTDNIWKYHVNQNFRGRNPDELETWRELHYRCEDERSARFESLTNKLKTKLEVATPLRKTKLAYVETTAGPKFNKSKAATIKTGMSSLKTREDRAGGGRGHGSSASSGGGGSCNNQQNILIEQASVIIPGKSRAGSAPASAVARESSAAAKKPRKAPLMQKTLKSMKTLLRR